jgi:dUTP pyrophosphatase
MIEILFKKLNENAVIPFQKHKGEDACYDLIATSCKYNPKYDRFEYGLGFATEFTPDWEAEIRPRSTNTKKNVYIPNAPGTIDSNYRGEWFVMFKHRVPFDMLFPTGDRDLNILEMENELAPYKVGEAVAQVKFNRVEQANWILVDELSDTSRGEDGGLVRK